MSMTAAITSSRWIKFPPTPPINPNSQSTTSNTIIVHNIVVSSFRFQDLLSFGQPLARVEARILMSRKDCAGPSAVYLVLAHIGSNQLILSRLIMIRQTTRHRCLSPSNSYSILPEVGWKLLVRARFGKERIKGFARFSGFARLTFAGPLPYGIECQLNY